MPIGIGRLEGLQILSKVVIGEADDEFKLSDLKGLIHLQGQLSIEGLHLVKNVIDAREVNLQDKKAIFDLQMKWSDVFDDSRDATTEQEVLERLIPSKKLRSLEILYYAGREFASWIGGPSFVCITELTLRGCKNCTCLPTLGHLPSLQKLFVGSMSGLKRVGSEFLAASNSCDGVAFPSLEVLEIRDMESWEEWSTGSDKAGAFPHLREISIIDCPKLVVVTITLLPSLQVLHVEGCSLAVLRSMVSMSSTIAKLRLVNIRGLTQLHGKVLEHLQAVEFLEISECDELTYLWESEAAGREILLSLQELRVRRCGNLVSLGEKEAHSNIRVKSVREVRIKHCARLESYNCPNSIEKLQIGSCPSVTSLTFPTDDLPSTLKKLAIWNCDSVEISWLMNNFLSSLESLHIWDMPSLRSFPEGCLFHLTSLEIDGCDNLESIPDDGYGFLPFFCLRQLKISHCKNLKSFPHEGLQSLASLREMDIRNCPSLDDSFPCGLWPPNLKKNLSFLEIGGLKKPVSEWGMQDFPTSLVRLLLHGENSGVVAFAMAGDTTSSSFLLPPSLTYLRIKGFKELESVSQGMQHLTRLQHLSIWSCPKLKDLPQTLLLSLSSLTMRGCSSNLRKKCRSKRGKYWPVISQIPIVKLC